MTDPDRHPPAPTDLLDRRSVRLGLFLAVPLALVALVSSAIHVSMLGIDHTILVFGERSLAPGSSTAVRLTLMSDKGALLVADGVSAELGCDGRVHPVPITATGEDCLFPARSLEVPAGVSGPCTMTLDIRFADKHRRVHYDVDVRSTPQAEALALAEDIPKAAPPSAVEVSGHRVEVFTEDRGAPTGLGSVLFLRATTEGFAPLATSLALRRSTEEDWDEQRTDKLGLLALPLRPFDMSARIYVRGGRRPGAPQPPTTEEKDSTAEPTPPQPTPDAPLEPLVVYSGITAAVHNPLVGTKERLRLTVRQLSAAGPLLVDAFKDGRYVAGYCGEARSGAAQMELRLPGPGLYRLQIASSVFSHAKAVAVRHVYALAESEDQNDGLRRLLRQLEASAVDREWAARVSAEPLERGSGYDRQTLAAFSLSRLYAGSRPLARLVSSRKEDDAELQGFKLMFQRSVMFAILLLGFGVAALTALIAVGASRRQQRITRMILAEPGVSNDDDALWHTDHGAADHKWRTALHGLVLFVIILGSFIALAVLVVVLRWFG